MKVLVTGANGMVGSALCPLLKKKGYEVFASDIDKSARDMIYLDVSNYQQIEELAGKNTFDIIIHLAAETDVDKCESQIDHAFRINTLGTENMALICQKLDIPLFYMSTAGVFDGAKKDPYNEFDVPCPVNIYGKSKHEGEKAVQNLLNKFFIVRAGWMMGGGPLKDKKFVAKIINLLKTKNELTVVNDKFGSPTYTVDLASNLIALIESKRFGIYHMTNKGVCSRYDVAVKIVEYLKLSGIKIKPITSDKFPLPASRANSEMMDNYKLTLLGLNQMRPWQEALRDYLTKYYEK